MIFLYSASGRSLKSMAWAAAMLTVVRLFSRTRARAAAEHGERGGPRAVIGSPKA